ncbi:ABC transporter substrate-binding protein [Tianweitania sediminis]|uniref:ABC transporter substrate-binding protein n=2 Tax=Tianweitania sediminis TaxID=1502156 RepID=A0A8J7UIB0_9HYPH|nr:ABC transporter substrate-binding protein [Tianweitania sediminis]MBP0440074.1 ABC transporter substrate-binding protein [Tianweitania sediminis]
MKKTLTTMALAACVSLSALTASSAQTVSGDEVTIGAIVDMSGVYSANGGQGAVVGAQMAIDDFGGTVLGKPIRLLSSNYQNKVDVTNTIVRSWIDNDNVDMVIESTDSASALAIQALGKDRNRLTIAAGSATTALTNDACTPLGIHYVYDTYALANGTGNAILREGGDSWYFVTADYAFGHSLERDTGNAVTQGGGTILGAARHPLGTADFSSFLLQAQSSGSKVVGLANAGADFSNAVKQAAEFGIVQAGQQIAGMLVFLTDIKALGLETAQGLTFTTGFYWDLNDETRAFAERFFERHNAMPTMIQAGFYSAVTHYLKGVEATGTDDSATVRKWMGENKINDFFAKDGYIREDGRMIHTMYLAKVKAPEESKRDWDFATILSEIPGEDAYLKPENSTCSLLKK